MEVALSKKGHQFTPALGRNRAQKASGTLCHFLAEAMVEVAAALEDVPQAWIAVRPERLPEREADSQVRIAFLF